MGEEENGENQVEAKLCVLLALALQALVLGFLFTGQFTSCYVGSGGSAAPDSSVDSDPRGYQIRHDFSDKALRKKVKQTMTRSYIRVAFFFAALLGMCINANAVVTHALEPEDKHIDKIWNWVELIAFVYAISGMSNVRNTHTRLEHLIQWTQKAKAFSLMQHTKFWSPGTLWDVYTQAKLAREYEGKDPRRALIPVAWSLVWAAMGTMGMMMKIRQVRFCVDRAPWPLGPWDSAWDHKEILLFIAFCNNVVGIVDTKMERMDAVLVLLFGGVDAEIVPGERGHANKVYDQIFNAIWAGNDEDVYEEERLGFFDRLVLAFTFGGADLQRLLVEEPEYEPPPADDEEGGTPSRFLAFPLSFGGLRNYAKGKGK